VRGSEKVLRRTLVHQALDGCPDLRREGHLERALIVWHPRRGTTPAVLPVRLDEEWFILDNLTLTIVNAAEATHYRPLFALDIGLCVVNRRLAVHESRI
jgi:hypothetical protein